MTSLGSILRGASEKVEARKQLSLISALKCSLWLPWRGWASQILPSRPWALNSPRPPLPWPLCFNPLPVCYCRLSGTISSQVGTPSASFLPSALAHWLTAPSSKAVSTQQALPGAVLSPRGQQPDNTLHERGPPPPLGLHP